MQRVRFTRMDQGSAEDFELLLGQEREEKPDLPGRVLTLLRSLGDVESGYQVNRLEHSLQTATRAQRDGAEHELVVCALLHDVGDLLAPDNHAEFAAALLKPYVSERNHWIVAHHGFFQGLYYAHHWGGDRHARERWRGTPHFEACSAFCDNWDQLSFDPDYPSLPLEDFEPLVHELFLREPRPSV